MTITDLPVRPRGRKVPDLPLHVFKDSGYTCHLRKMSPLTLTRIMQGIEREARALPSDDPHAYPLPPREEINVGGGDEVSAEENPSDPAYQARLKKWAGWQASEANERFLRIAAADACEFPDDEYDPVIVARVKRRLAAVGAPEETPAGYSDEDTDKFVWLIHCCIGSTEDLQEFFQAAQARARVTPQQVEAEIATFRAAE